MRFPSFPAGLRQLPSHPWSRRALRIGRWAGFVIGVLLAIVVLTLRYAILPQVSEYRADIERMLSDAIRRPVHIASVEGHWRSFWPNLRIRGVEIRDAEGRTALAFSEVDVDVAWASLWHFAPRFSRIEISNPNLDVRRDAEGRFFVAGLEIDPNAEKGGFSDWLFDQHRIVVREATITWTDGFRQAPSLALAHVNLDLRNSGSGHRFGFTAEPPPALAARLDVRGELEGDDLGDLAAWRGELYAELDYADLAVWQAWVDYPIDLPRGNGGVRVWLGFGDGALNRLTADIRLSDVAVRLGADLPMLELTRVDGRLAGTRSEEGYAIRTRRLALAANNGIELSPTDVEAEWRPSAPDEPGYGKATANGLDLQTLTALATYLPFDAAFRERLLAYAPRGVVHDLSVSWHGDFDKLSRYALKARFENLGLNAQGTLPGFAGLDGRIEGNEKGGSLELNSRAVDIELPAVFPQSNMPLAVLEARADWEIDDGVVDARLSRAAFQNQDAAGEASGRYRSAPTGPGTIDLSARLSRADGGAVWRYMPLVVNQMTRDWLQRSIVGGTATATLRLKGDLKHFPFSDGSGIFEVKGPFQGASLHYAPDWPVFEDVAGDLEFVGSRMTIRAHTARLWDVVLTDVKAEIADLSHHEELMTVTGTARGPTGDFLRFIETSPVGEHIDHVTADMTASGNGELQLQLDLPLRHIVDTKVDGRYRFASNGLTYDADMPPLADVSGDLQFTGNTVTARRIRGSLLGAPMTLDVATEGGKVAVKAAGTLTVRGLREQYGSPVLDHLTGSAPWSGSIQVSKQAGEVRIQSSLQGISSSLPEPFNKSAADAMPLLFERKPFQAPAPVAKGRAPAAVAPGVRDQVALSLGNALRMRLLRRHDGGRAVVEQGVVAIGQAEPRMPDRGMALAVQTGRVDADFWRRLAASGSESKVPPLTQIDLRTDELKLFGRSFSTLQLSGTATEGGWHLALASREAAGTVEWNGEGQGRLKANLSRLALPEGVDSPATTVQEQASSMPAIDVMIDRFLVQGREVGELKAKADNKDGAWNATFELRNDDGLLAGSGRWRASATQTQTQVDVRLSARSIEKLLGRFGYANVIRRGTADIEGNLSWAGPPTALDYASLNGRFKLDAARGQFNKLEPGVGRLLGIMSLQSLPRRIALDFRDIFSEGFAFDSISGSFAVSRGVMETKDLQIQGPAAKVLMHGNVNLVAESQDLKVRVQPTLGETVATGVLFVNPAVGAAAWALNKLFGNPIDKAFAFDYAVTGAWADPKVEKLAVQGPGGEQKPAAQ